VLRPSKHCCSLTTVMADSPLCSAPMRWSTDPGFSSAAKKALPSFFADGRLEKSQGMTRKVPPVGTVRLTRCVGESRLCGRAQQCGRGGRRGFL